MRFMHEVWRPHHILSRNRRLLLYEFQADRQLNFGMARTEHGELVGLFGFMPYNQQRQPDLAGSIWKVDPRAHEPMLGLRLREFVIRSVPHRYFAAPGAGLQTRPIYQAIDMEWVRMRQYYLLNPTLRRFELAVVDGGGGGPVAARRGGGPVEDGLEIRRVSHPAELRAFPFDPHAQRAPFKDWAYVQKRFFEHPIYTYDVFLITRRGVASHILVCRQVGHEGASAYRIVDFFGDDDAWPGIAAFLQQRLIRHGHEYVDFICHGVDDGALTSAGFEELDLDQQERIVPNYFEPFARKNVPIYAVADRSPRLRLRLFKADGDQDRPNQ